MESGTGVAVSCSQALPYIKPALVNGPGPVLVPSYDDSPTARDLGNGLLVFYVVDEGETLRYVQNRDLSAAGMDATALHGLAMENLAKMAAERMRIEPYGGIFALFLDGNFEASLLLLDDLWDGPLGEHAPNGVLAAVPARDVVAFADAASQSGADELKALIARVTRGGDHLICSGLYRREDRSWKPLVPAGPELQRGPRSGLLSRLRNWFNLPA